MRRYGTGTTPDGGMTMPPSAKVLLLARDGVHAQEIEAPPMHYRPRSSIAPSKFPPNLWVALAKRSAGRRLI